MDQSVTHCPTATHIECALIGLSGLMAFIAWDLSFNMQVLIPVVLYLVLAHLHKGFYVDKANMVFLAIAIAGACSSLLYNALADPKIVDAKSFIRLGYYAEILLFYIVVVSKKYTGEQLRLIAAYNVLVGVIVALGVIAAYLGGATGKIAPVNVWGNELAENSTGAMLVFYLLFALVAFISSCHLLSKLALTASIAVMTFGMLLTGSRAAYLGVAIGAAVLFLLFLSDTKVGITVKILVILSIMLAVWGFIENAAEILPDFTYKRLFAPNYDDASDATRMILWKNGLEGIAHRPILGYGIGNFNYYVVNSLGMSEHVVVVAHNTYLDVLLDVGIVGSIAIIWMIARGMRGVFRSRLLLPMLAAGLFTSLIIGAERTYILWDQIVIVSIYASYTHANGGKAALESALNFDLLKPRQQDQFESFVENQAQQHLYSRRRRGTR